MHLEPASPWGLFTEGVQMYSAPYPGGQILHTGLPSLVITNVSPCWTSFMILRQRRRAWLLLMTNSIQSPIDKVDHHICSLLAGKLSAKLCRV